MNFKWYCVHTKPLRENYAGEQLSNQLGLEVYFPRMRSIKTIRRVRKVVSEPLFPRYLFCRFDLNLSFRAVRYAQDVIDVVSFGTAPAVLDKSLVDDLRAWAGNEIFISHEPAFHAGEQVLITAGPMQGLKAVILEAQNANERVSVLLSFLGANTRLMINRDQLSKAI